MFCSQRLLLIVIYEKPKQFYMTIIYKLIIDTVYMKSIKREWLIYSYERC
jgi:hypothetical protein